MIIYVKVSVRIYKKLLKVSTVRLLNIDQNTKIKHMLVTNNGK